MWGGGEGGGWGRGGGGRGINEPLMGGRGGGRESVVDCTGSVLIAKKALNAKYFKR